MELTRMWSRARVAAVGAVVLIVLGSAVGLYLLQPQSPPPGPTSVVLHIGDGMGTGQLAAARYARSTGGYLTMDWMEEGGLVTTHSADNVVTDSAAAATALATGVKTNNGMVGVDPEGESLETILEYAQATGRATGLVTTTRLTHATPAAFASHVPSRGMEDEIALQLLASGVDVLLGGGRSHFLPTDLAGGARSDGRNLVEEAQEGGYAYVETERELMLTVGRSDRILGLFAQDHMSWDLEAGPLPYEPSLRDMAVLALDVLGRNPEGFFLMVEGGRIDHAGHANNLTNTIGETLAFDDALDDVLAHRATSPETLIVVTADHETGGLSLLPSEPGELNVFWATTGHTANPVPIYAEGTHAEWFAGNLDNTDVGERLFTAMGRPAVCEGDVFVCPQYQPSMELGAAGRMRPLSAPIGA